jgi:predicted transcriptional regulator
MSEVKISENSISESLKIILVKKNMNIARLANLMNVSSTTLYSKFKRENFTIKDLNEISKALNLDYEVIFTIKE